MKANPCSPAVFSQAALAALVAALGACVPAAPPPLAHPASPPRVVQRPAPQSASGDWRDMPQTPGNWTWSRDTRGTSRASFGAALSLACVQAGQVRMVVTDRSGAVTIRTTSVTRTVGSVGSVSATIDFQASDPLLDAMAFSRGRFALDFRDSAPLIVPSWPEIGRVIEDCR